MTIITDLQRSIREEHEAARRYRLRAKTADPVTRTLYQHISQEEMVHAREFSKRLAAVRIIRRKTR